MKITEHDNYKYFGGIQGKVFLPLYIYLGILIGYNIYWKQIDNVY